MIVHPHEYERLKKLKWDKIYFNKFCTKCKQKTLRIIQSFDKITQRTIELHKCRYCKYNSLVYR